jgi:hypothetical protein
MLSRLLGAPTPPHPGTEKKTQHFPPAEKRSIFCWFKRPHRYRESQPGRNCISADVQIVKPLRFGADGTETETNERQTMEHEHNSIEGERQLAVTCVRVAQEVLTKYPLSELSPGDIYCKAVDEAAEGKRSSYTPSQTAWFAARHIMEKQKRKAASRSLSRAISLGELPEDIDEAAIPPEHETRSRRMDILAVELLWLLIPLHIGRLLDRQRTIDITSRPPQRKLLPDESRRVFPYSLRVLLQYRTDITLNQERRQRQTAS